MEWLERDVDELVLILKTSEVDKNIYNKVKDLYLSQSSFTDRILIFSTLIKMLKEEK